MTDSFWSLKLKELRERRKEQENGDFSPQKISALRERIARWEEAVLGPVLSETPERKDLFENPSGIPLNRVYTPTDVTNVDYVRDLGLPGEYPYTRGVYPTMYRGRPWTMRMFSGFGTADQTNKRLKYLLKEGETGLSIALTCPHFTDTTRIAIGPRVR